MTDVHFLPAASTFFHEPAGADLRQVYTPEKSMLFGHVDPLPQNEGRGLFALSHVDAYFLSTNTASIFRSFLQRRTTIFPPAWPDSITL